MKKVLANPISVFASYLVLVCLLGLVIILGLSRRILDTAQFYNESLIPIYSGQSVRQSISPQNSGLNTVLIYLRNPNRVNSDAFNFKLMSAQSEVLREVPISGSNIGEGDTIRFQFSPLTDSADHEYTIELSAPDTVLENAVLVGVSRTDIYPGGALIAPALPESDMSFQLFYRPQNRQQLLQDVAAFVAQRFSQPTYLVLAITSIILGYFALKRMKVS